MTQAQRIDHFSNPNIAPPLPPRLTLCEVLDDIEGLADDEIENYVCHLQQVGHQSYEIVTE